MAVLDTAMPAAPPRKGPFWTHLYFQVIAAIILGGTIGWLYKINWFSTVLGAGGLDNSIPWVKD